MLISKSYWTGAGESFRVWSLYSIDRTQALAGMDINVIVSDEQIPCRRCGPCGKLGDTALAGGRIVGLCRVRVGENENKKSSSTGRRMDAENIRHESGDSRGEFGAK